MEYILVVEDDEDIRLSLQHLLEDEGHKVATAGNGARALELLEGGPRPSLMLVDLFMPVMDGIELLHHLRASSRHADIPVVVLSAASNVEIPPGTPRLDKPVTYKALMQQIQKICGG